MTVAVRDSVSNVAMMVVDPAPIPRARPAASIAAMSELALDHATRFVRSVVVPFAVTPAAVNCDVWPISNVALVGVNVIDTNGSGLWMTVAVRDRVSNVGSMVCDAAAIPRG